MTMPRYLLAGLAIVALASACTETRTAASAAEPPTAGQIVVTELMINPAAHSDDVAEWIELTNVTDQALDLKGCTFSDNGHDAAIAGSVVLPAGQRRVIAVGKAGSPTPVPEPAWRWGDFNLGNDGDTATLRCGGQVVDAVGWTTELLLQPLQPGRSLALCDEHLSAAANDDLRNWRLATLPMLTGDYGTPGADNGACYPLQTAVDADAGLADAGPADDAGEGADTPAVDAVDSVDGTPDPAGDGTATASDADGSSDADAGDADGSSDADDATTEPPLSAQAEKVAKLFGFDAPPAPACEVPGPEPVVKTCKTVTTPAGGSVEACVVVPPGTCHVTWIGSDASALIWFALPQEHPRVQVRLSPFAVSRFPTTVAEYRECVEAGGCSKPEPDNCTIINTGATGDPGTYADDSKLNHPVTCVTRAQARDYCTWVGGDLITEAQFEHASTGPLANAAAYRLFPWGDKVDHCHTNVGGLPQYPGAPDPFETTSPVGFFDGSLRDKAASGWAFGPAEYQTCDDASPHGLHDMAGNVMVHVRDGVSSYAHWPKDELDPVRKLRDHSLMMRGTAWMFPEIMHARVFTRGLLCNSPLCGFPMEVTPEMASPGIGIRCVFGGGTAQAECTDDASCDDGDPCTADSCNPATKACKAQPVANCGTSCKDASQCDDGDPCTADICNKGQCIQGVSQTNCVTPCFSDAECDATSTTNCEVGWCPPATKGCFLGVKAGCPNVKACAKDADCTSPDKCTIGKCHPTLKSCYWAKAKPALCQ